MNRIRKRVVLIVTIGALLFGYVLAACQREDGLPDPPLRSLVPCVPDAAEGDPLACPPVVDMAVDMATFDLDTSDQNGASDL